MELQQQVTGIYASGTLPDSGMPYTLYYYLNYQLIHTATNNLKFQLYNNLKSIFNHLEFWQVQYITIIYCCTFLFIIGSASIFMISKRKRLNILANFLGPDISVYKSELKYYSKLLDSLENMNIQSYIFNLETKEQQIKASSPMKEHQLMSLSKIKVNLQSPYTIIVYGIAYIILCLGLLIVAIQVLEFTNKALNTVELAYKFNDLVYYTGSVYAQRDILYLNSDTKFVSQQLFPQFINEIQAGLNFIGNYNSNPPSTNNLLLSQQFLNINFSLSQSNFCSIDLPGVKGYTLICQTAFSGILTKGLTQTLSNIVTSLTQEMLLNNFTQRVSSPSIDLPGAFILSEYLNNIDKAMFQEIHSTTNDYYNIIILVSSIYIVFLVLIIGFIIYLFNYRLSTDMQNSLYFVYLMPLKILFYDDSFERKVRGSIIHNDQI